VEVERQQPIHALIAVVDIQALVVSVSPRMHRFVQRDGAFRQAINPELVQRLLLEQEVDGNKRT
jgi:hypothetical protein